eukprot:gene16809-biopygen17287
MTTKRAALACGRQTRARLRSPQKPVTHVHFPPSSPCTPSPSAGSSWDQSLGGIAAPQAPLRGEMENDKNAAPQALQSTKRNDGKCSVAGASENDRYKAGLERDGGKGMLCGTPSFLRVVTAFQ